jgi:hypothetical protein
VDGHLVEAMFGVMQVDKTVAIVIGYEKRLKIHL